jgi:Fe-S-cluster-containing dehydrogenase component
VVAINTGCCDGCGVCVDACATGAIYLVSGKAAVDDVLCRDYRAEINASTAACVSACPAGAIVITEQEQKPEVDAARVLAPRPGPEVIVVKTEPVPVSLRARVLPVVGGAMAWAGREIVPRLADYVLCAMERRTVEGRTATYKPNGGSASREMQQNRRRRHRRRGS